MTDNVRVRMYEVGFGDCFLIEFPRKDDPTPFRILVDCGAHSSGYPREGWKPEQVVDQIVADVTTAGEPHIDVVVATHRHQDHVVGFRAKAWSQVSVGEVWLPWTENPKDPLARAILNRQSRLAFGLQAAFQSAAFGARWTNPERAASLRDLVTNSLTNASAMRTLHSGFLGKPKRRYLSVADPATITSDFCPGLTVHVLGPSKDEEVIRDMDPPAGQSYLHFLDPSMPMDAEAIGGELSSEMERQLERSQRPFSRNFTFPATEYESDPAALLLDAETKEAAAAFMREDDLAVAVSLDKAVNGTSLMLMFEFGDAFLLFPGDAQWGTWRGAMDDAEHRDLLSRTTFLKVGHHGSHNATPKEFVEDVLGAKLWCAAASVRPINFWPEIPKADLLTALGKRSERVIRSDQPGRRRKGVSVRRGVGVDFTVPH
ncbi:MAG: hypothetical protein Q8Q52_04665 [Acidimicrobiia bacterium]|nr:hypothetical protein [Acidimicrobiia bacterium]